MQIPLLIKPTTHPPEWSASLFGLSWLSVYQEPVSDFTWEAHEGFIQGLASQPGARKMGFGKEALGGGHPEPNIDFKWGGAVLMLDICGPLCE